MVATGRRSPGSLGKRHPVPLLGDERDCARYRRLLPYPQDRGSRVVQQQQKNLPPLWRRRRRRPSSDEPGHVTYQELVALRGARAVSGMSMARPVWFVRILSAIQVSTRP